MSFPQLRKRVPSQPVTGANTRIMAGVFGVGQAVTPPIPSEGSGFDGIYNYHEGDIFTPGAMNWVFEPTTELPLYAIWGKAFTRIANTFNPIQPPQIYAQPHVVTSGMGGLQAGQLELQPLLVPDETELPFSG